MKSQTLWIPMPMPGQNDVIGAANRNRHAWNGLKKKWSAIVALYARQQDFQHIDGPAHFEFEFFEQSRRRDPDNFTSGARKVIFDSLQEAGLMDGDGWQHVLSWTDEWHVNKAAPGVRVTARWEAKNENAREPIGVGRRQRTRTTAKRLESYAK